MIDYSYIVFLLHLASALFMTGVIWFVQLVHYPLLRDVRQYREAAYEFTALRRATWVFGPPMLLELASGAWLVWRPPDFLPAALNWGNLALLSLLWLVTFQLATKHQVLAIEYNEKVHHSLVRRNWFRTGAWSLRVLALLYVLGTTRL